MATELTPFAVVQIEDSPAALIVIGAVLLLTFVLVAYVAYRLIAGAAGLQGDAEGRGVTFSVSSPLPVSKATFDRLTAATAAGLKVPERTPATEAYREGLRRTRSAAHSLSRILALAGGAVLVALAVTLYQQATPANMLLLPAGILALLGAGALLKGLTPERRIEPIDPRLLEKIRVTTSTNPMTVRLDRFALTKAAELRRSGASWDEVARHVHPGYDALQAFEQAAVVQAISQAVEADQRAR